MTIELKSNAPTGPIQTSWERHRQDIKVVNPANKRKYKVIVVGTGLAGASAGATLAELGYDVMSFCFQDSPRRAHSIAAQGGINAAKNYQNDGDSVWRLFYDTVKGGDFRSRESNVYRLAQVSVNIIDQAVAQGVPFAREYGGLLANRSFGGALVSRTFYARGQTGQQLLLGAYQAHARMVHAGKIKMFPRTEMLDLVVVDGHARGIVVRDLVSGEIRSYSADAVVLGTGGYGNVSAIMEAIESALRARKLTVSCPWFFPSREDYQRLLNRSGFVVRSIDLIPRPTPLPGDIGDWLETFAQSYISALPKTERAGFIAEVVEALRPVLCDANGNWVADYVRLRFAAIKPRTAN